MNAENYEPEPSACPEFSDSQEGGVETAVQYVVGIGASAGGLEALEKFFDAMPTDCNVAYVVVQHLSPDFKSLMDEILGRRTSMRVERVEHGVNIEPNVVYLIPPKKEMIVSDGKLLLSDKNPEHGIHLPIDIFFRSLAQEMKENAISIVLSGTGSDGSRGIRSIQEAGGLVIVQSLGSAKFDGMPQSAIDTGVVDLVTEPENMPAAIEKYINHHCNEDANQPTPELSCVDEILQLLRRSFALDFKEYKMATIRRRIERRLVVSHADSLENYLEKLQAEPKELQALYRDLLIGVTRFFRDGKAFETLTTEVLPKLFENRSSEDEVRIWVVGCASGEEAYSLAILINELLEVQHNAPRVKIFATDVHRSSVEFASNGLYSEASIDDVPPDLRAKYFSETADGYCVNATVRQMIVFAPHNVIRNAPFTRMNLVTCRNMLIYLNSQAQQKVLSLFHFSLLPRGILFLGSSESLGDLADEFEPISVRHKIFSKVNDSRLPSGVRLPTADLAPLDGGPVYSNRGAKPASKSPTSGAQQILLKEFGPPSLLLDKDFKLQEVFCGAGKYLTMPDGHSSLNVLDIIPAEMRLTFSSALQRVQLERKEVNFTGVPCTTVQGVDRIRLSVRLIADQQSLEDHFLVSFIPADNPNQAAEEPLSFDLDTASQEQIQNLQVELNYTKENLQAALEEMETTNEELQASNEELVASNEELQSTNEELQSVNEELYTVNAEYQRKIIELTQLNSDMDNLLASTEIGTVFLDRGLRLRKFTPQIAEKFNLVPHDLGRSIESFAHTLNHAGLLDDFRRVIDQGIAVEKEVHDREGQWYLMRIIPYRTKGDAVAGIVMSLVGITSLKQAQNNLERMSQVVMNSTDAIIIEDLNGTIIDFNREAEEIYGYTREELQGRPITILWPESAQENSIQLREKCLAHEPVRNVEVKRVDKAGNITTVLLTVAVLTSEEGELNGLATIAKDITRRKNAELALRTELRRRDEFLATLSHELRNPLGAVLNAARVIRLSLDNPETLNSSIDIIEKQLIQSSRLLDDLLDISRIANDKIALREETLDLRVIARDALETVSAQFEQRGHTIEIETPNKATKVKGDQARLLQVAENLLSNAAKYTPKNGHIRLVVEQASDMALLRVSDNGRGLTKQTLKTIFEPFSQGVHSVETGDGGMGVGLSLVKSLVELHGGSIEAKSKGKNMGSDFIVRLPLTTHKLKKSKPVKHEAKLTKKRIGLVEDNQHSRKSLSMLLDLEGFQVTDAHNAASGLEMIAKALPEVAILDIGLPDMTGYELAIKIREQLKERTPYLIALTGYGRDSDRKAVFEAGFDAHLVKPLDIDKLFEALQDLPAEEKQ